MKGYLQPLSESFVYGSPERPASGSYRWVAQGGAKRHAAGKRQQEVRHAGRRKH